MSKKYKKNKSKWQNTWARTPVYKKAPIFQPHTFKTETILTYSFSPKILITPEAFKKMGIKPLKSKSFNVKKKAIAKAFGTKGTKEATRAVACDYVIDTNKRTKFGQEPRMTS